MKRILALVDLTEISLQLVGFAQRIADSSSEIHLVHISTTANEAVGAKATQALESLTGLKKGTSSNFVTHMVYGTFNVEVIAVVERLQPDLVIVGTHGKKGMRQNFFGSNILHLIQNLPVQTLVIQETSTIPHTGFKDVFIPVSAHQNWSTFVGGMIDVAGKSANYNLYAIYKGNELHQLVRNGIREMKAECSKYGVSPTLIEEEAKIFSVGYSRQTLDYLKENQVDLICIWSHTSELHYYFGDLDKEALLLNPSGIPVLCCP